MGQLRQMGKQFYDTDIHVEVLSEQMVGDYSHVTMRYSGDSALYCLMCTNYFTHILHVLHERSYFVS